MMAFLLCLIPAIGFAGERDESEIINIHEADVEMNAAMLHAKQSLDVFLHRFKNPEEGDSDFALKVMVSDDYGVEHFWVADVALTAEGFEGVVANEARTVQVIDIGHKIEFGPELVTDWSYNHYGVKQGAFTLKVLLKRMPEEQADYYRKAVGWN
ncbi:MAG: DUF2314 domain-containing protein [Pseudomonadota bacterium]